jgi:hypothetical protein
MFLYTSEKQDSETSLPIYDILTYPADFTLEVLVGKLDNGEIKVPPLQRRFIWPIERASIQVSVLTGQVTGDGGHYFGDYLDECGAN